MGFTIRQATTAELDQDPEIKTFVEGLYESPLSGPPPEPGNGAQFDYDDLSPEDLVDLIGEVSKANAPIGVYVDIDPVKKGDYYVFSITRLAEDLKSKAPSPKRKGMLFRLFGAGTSGFSAKDEFTDAVAEFAGNPRGEYPIVTIWW